MFWPDVELAIYPLIDDSVQRLLAFRFNLVANVSIVPQATGSLQIMVDTLELADVYESYNEIGTDFDPSAVADLIGVFLPTLLEDSDALAVDLGPESLGAPIALKVRKLTVEGPQARHLAVYLRICSESDLADEANALCYETPDTDASNEAELIDGADIRFNESTQEWELQLANGSLAGEYAIRVDGRGPWQNFRAPNEDGILVLDIPQLRFPGQHLIEVMVRAAGKLSTQRVTKEFPVISHAANRFAGHVRDGLVAVHTWGEDGQSTDTLVDVLLRETQVRPS